MEHVLFYFAAANLLICIGIAAVLIHGGRQVQRLEKFAPPDNEGLPKVSVIVPARNEERDIEASIRALLRQDYENIELLVVNDRSTDRTGEILDRLAAEHPRLNVVHLSELPAGWLGKNHAMQLGALRAIRGRESFSVSVSNVGDVEEPKKTPDRVRAGDEHWLLFTDADVVMEPTTLRRAVGYAIQHGIDHLPMMMEVRMPNVLLESFVVLFMIYFSAYFRPWKAKDPKSKAYVGIGAFNLIRADVYRAIGTHQRIAMRPDDDVKLGKIVKRGGYRQEMLNASGLMYVPWYNSLREVIVGLEKNAFSGVEYNPAIIVASSAVGLLFNVWPFAAVFFTGGVTQLLYLAAALCLLGLGWHAAGTMRVRRRSVLLFPVAVLLFIFIQWRAMLLTYIHNGIRWRDTHYSLAELKANKV
jgi:glycosyltransferase involved in cell wall biosynthesis